MTEIPHVRENADGDVIPHDDDPVDHTVRYTRPDTTEYMVDAAAKAAQTLMFVSERLGVDKQPESEVAEMPYTERLATVKTRYKFLPHTKDELNDTISLVGKNLVGGSATHLNAVFNHQKNYEVEEPARAVRAIVVRYAEYAKNAFLEHAFLSKVAADFGDGKGGVNLSSMGTDWQHSDSLARPMLRVLWSRDTMKYIREGEGDDPLKALAEGAYSASNRRALDAAQALITKSSKSAFSDTYNQSMNAENARYDFWVKALQEARKHAAAAGVAYSALVELGVEEK